MPPSGRRYGPAHPPPRRRLSQRNRDRLELLAWLDVIALMVSFPKTTAAFIEESTEGLRAVIREAVKEAEPE